jgi:hypothetical protein
MRGGVRREPAGIGREKGRTGPGPAKSRKNFNTDATERRGASRRSVRLWRGAFRPIATAIEGGTIPVENIVLAMNARGSNGGKAAASKTIAFRTVARANDGLVSPCTTVVLGVLRDKTSRCRNCRQPSNRTEWHIASPESPSRARTSGWAAQAPAGVILAATGTSRTKWPCDQATKNP